MSTCPHDNNFKLCQHWLYNAKNNILNKEILNLQISSQGVKTFEIVKTLIRTIIKEEHEDILDDSKYCFATKSYSIHLGVQSDIPDIQYEQNRNIILVTFYILDFKEFNREVLCVNLKDYALDLDKNFKKGFLNQEVLNQLINGLDNFVYKPKISQFEEHKYYIKKLPLKELFMNKQYKKIGDFIHDMILFESSSIRFNKLLLGSEYLLSKKSYKNLIIDDIRMFVEEKILSKRLCFVMYRLCSLEIDADVSEITKYFTQTLVLGNSESLHLANLDFISRDLNSDTKYDVYDLRYLESKQIQLAEQIIINEKIRYGDEPNFEFDKELIHEVTHLSYEQIEQLINKDLI